MLQISTGKSFRKAGYYPFGMMMPGRKYINGNGYRYGFNGKENDNEAKGEGNQQDYGFRIYDPRIGRFLSVDPLTKDYPFYTPYQFAGNMPITFVDLDGLEPGDPETDEESLEIQDPNETKVINEKGECYSCINTKYDPKTMKLSKEGLNFIKNYEQYKQYIYDAGDGLNTIGYGYVIPPKELDKYKNGITEEEASRLLNEKITSYVDVVRNNITVPLTQAKFDALVAFQYNTYGLAKQTTVRKLINKGAFWGEIETAWKEWNQVTDRKTGIRKVNQGLVNRRADEWEMYYSADYKRNH